MDGNNQDNQNPTEQLDDENVSMLDKLVQKNPFVSHGPVKLENIQTQSMVKSSREEAEGQLANIKAHNDEILRQQRLAEGATKAKRTGVYAAIAIIFIVMAIVAGWIIINAITASQGGAGSSGGGGSSQDDAKNGKVGSYKCKTDQCKKIATVDSKRSVIKDGQHYYVFNVETKESVLTTIPEKEYHEITTFSWGDKFYAIIDPEAEQSALFSITDNRQITDFAYDEFYTDTSKDEYKDMEYVVGEYIVAKSSDSYRLIRLSNGKEMIRANKRVYTKNNFYFGYENDNTIRAYNNVGEQMKVVPASSTIFVGEKIVVVIDEWNGYQLFSPSGAEPDWDDSARQYIESLDWEKVKDALSTNSSYTKVPPIE